MARWNWTLCGAAALLALACTHRDAKRAAASAGAAGNAAESASASPPIATAQPLQEAESRAIVVNGEPLSNETIEQLQQVYPVAIPPGRYWYDAMSGAWGHEGEPVAGQMMAGLRLGGSLAANASRGTSGVYVNGRQITLGEKGYLEA